MVGIAALEARRGRRPALEESRVLGLRLLRASIPAPAGLGEGRLLGRTARAGRALARAGVRRVLAAADFPCWPALAAAGLRPVETEAFCQTLAVPLALAWLRRAGVRPTRACLALSGPRVGRPLFAAAEALCPRVRHLIVDVPGGEGAELAAWLREEYGAAVLDPAAAEPDLTLAFAPGGRTAGPALELYGPAPGLDGLCPAPAEGDLPAGLDRLPLLALLWESGRLGAGDVRILAGGGERIDLTGGGKLPIISY